MYSGYTRKAFMTNVVDIMSKKVMTVKLSSSFRDIWNLILKQKINAVPVVDHRKKIVGIIAKEDILQKLYPNYSEYIETVLSTDELPSEDKNFKELLRLKAKEIMHRTVIFTRTETPIMRALARMVARRVNQLPVVSEHDTVVGIITKGDIFKYLYRSHKKIFQ